MTFYNKNQNPLHTLIDQMEIFGNDLFISKEELSSSFSSKKYVSENQPLKVSDSNESFLFEAENDFWSNAKDLNDLYSKINTCTKCKLHKNRMNFVFGSGNPNSDVMIIGEGPGAEEDIQGLPFVGRAGMLLTDILKAIKFSRDEVYIANIVKCRPPNNRTPFQDEMDTCLPYLKKQIELIQPKIILCLGLTAAKGLLGKKDSLTSLRGKVFNFNNSIKVMVTFHPAALLRNPGWKRDCWKDVQEFRKLYDEIKSNSN